MYGFGIAAFFQWMLYSKNIEDRLIVQNMNEDEENNRKILENIFKIGGKTLDIELAELLLHIYQLGKSLNIDCFSSWNSKDINWHFNKEFN